MISAHPHFRAAPSPLNWAAGLSLLVATASWPGHSETPENVDEAQAVLARTASAEFTTLRGEIRLESRSPLSAQGPGLTQRGAVTVIGVVLARPNRFRVTVTSPSPDGDGLCVSDGERAVYASQMLRQVAEAEAPADLGSVDPVNLALTGAAASVLLPAALGIRPPILETMGEPEETTARLLEPRNVGGTVCDVVELVAERGGETMTIRLMIDREVGLVRLFEMTMETALAEQPAQMTEEFVDLEIDGPVTEADFESESPPGLQPVPAFDAGAVIRQFGVESP